MSDFSVPSNSEFDAPNSISFFTDPAALFMRFGDVTKLQRPAFIYLLERLELFELFVHPDDYRIFTKFSPISSIYQRARHATG